MMTSEQTQQPNVKPQWLPVNVRWMIRDDMPEVMEIENFCFTLPWSENEYISVLRQSNCRGKVAQTGRGEVVGLLVYLIERNSLVVLNLAVHPDYWRRGVATQLLASVVGKLAHHRQRHLKIEVRERNLTAQLFLRSCGLKAVRITHRAYEDNDEDCITFQYELPECDEPRRQEFQE